MSYSDEFLQAVDTIVQERLREMSFDKTEVCTIVSEVQNTKGAYWVSNGTVKYIAYSSDSSKNYSKDKKVYVIIPQGNYDATKAIIGEYIASEQPAALYETAFSKFIPNNKYTIVEPVDGIKVIAENKSIDESIGEKFNISDTKTIDFTFYKSEFGSFDSLGIKFSFITNFGGSTGNYKIIIELLDSNGNTIITLPFDSKQLFGNPYYLDANLEFEHLFSIDDIENIENTTQLRIGLIANNQFNHKEEEQYIILNNLDLYTGFLPSNIEDEVLIGMEGPEDLIYYSSSDTKQLKLDWLYNNYILGSSNRPIEINEGEYVVYWLRYTETPGYKKLLETDQDVLRMAYEQASQGTTPLSKEKYAQAINNIYEKRNNEVLQAYDSFLYDTYVNLYDDNIEIFEQNLINVLIDIEESGPYWKTIKKIDLFDNDAYTFSLNPNAEWNKEQIKVIIKSLEDGVLQESNGLTFTNANYSIDIEIGGVAQHSGETLQFTFGSGNGIYTNYGIDNKLLSISTPTETLTVDYIDNTEWEPSVQKVLWKVPKHNTMIVIPEVAEGETDPWERLEDNNYYILKCNNVNDNDNYASGRTIQYTISEQFGYNKTNNTIYCEITRSSPTADVYRGSVKLQFGTHGTSGTNFSFNIYPNDTSGLLYYHSGIKDSITYNAVLEDQDGNIIPIDNYDVYWYYQVDGNLSSIKEYDKQTFCVLSNDTKPMYTPQSGSKYNIVLVAKLTNWRNDINNNSIDLYAYYPVIQTSNKSYNIKGASRIIYDFQGTSPDYDTSAYQLYDDNGVVENVYWRIKFSNWEDCYDSDGTVKQIGVLANYPTLKEISLSDNSNVKQYVLQPLSHYPLRVLSCSVAAYSSNIISEQSYKETWLCEIPLVILSNQYSLDILNEWNGEISANNNGTIFTQIIGAGKKEADNSYTGVLMGTYGKISSSVKTGLYGFNSGQIRYKLDEDGSFYVGNGSSYIELDNENNTGELVIKVNTFDLDTGTLDISSANSNIVVTNEHEETNVILGKYTTGTDPNVKTHYGLAIYGGGMQIFDENNKVLLEASAEAKGLKMTGGFTHTDDNNIVFSTIPKKIEMPQFSVSTSNRVTFSYTDLNVNGFSLADGSKEDLNQLAVGRATHGNYDATWTDAYFYNQGSRVYFINKPPAWVQNQYNGGYYFETYASYVSNGKETSPWGVGILEITPQQIYLATYSQESTGTSGTKHYMKLGENEFVYDGKDIATTTQSDIRFKKNIENLDEQYNKFFDNLLPKRFKYIDGTSDRYHTGFVAQEICSALDKASLSTQDFAGIYSTKDPELNEERYYLRLEEFISLNTWQIQKLKARIQELETEIKEIKHNEIN